MLLTKARDTVILPIFNPPSPPPPIHKVNPLPQRTDNYPPLFSLTLVFVKSNFERRFAYFPNSRKTQNIIPLIVICKQRFGHMSFLDHLKINIKKKTRMNVYNNKHSNAMKIRTWNKMISLVTALIVQNPSQIWATNAFTEKRKLFYFFICYKSYFKLNLFSRFYHSDILHTTVSLYFNFDNN